MTARRLAPALAVLALVLPAVVAAQGLGDAAAREKAKRQAAKKAGEAKVFTNDDLNEGRAGTPAAEAASPAAASSAAPASENPPLASDGRPSAPPPDPDQPTAADEATDGRTQEQAFVDAVTSAQSRVTQIEARIQELQGRLNPMSSTYIYGDFNVGGDKVAEEAQVKAELAQVESELSSARQELAAATRAHQDFRQGRVTAPPVPR